MDTHHESFDIGTESWLDDTGGRLTFPQALGISVQGLAQAARNGLDRGRPTQLEQSGQLARVAVARRELGVVLKSQRDRVSERQGEGLLNHACRTFLLGAALVSDEDFGQVDLTASAVAALAHDDGLLHPSSPGKCFTADSATESDTMMGHLHASDGAADVARAAVISHFQPKLPPQSGVDARLVALGASADVMGFGLRKISPQLMVDLWHEWPDLGFLVDVRRLLKGERTRAPWTRPGVLSWSGMPYLLRSTR